MVRGRNTNVWEESDDEDMPASKLDGSDLHKYAERGNAKGVAMLIRRGGRGKLKVNLNGVDEKGRTALILACRNGNSRVTDFLMQAGAQSDIKDNEGLAAIHHCVYAIEGNGNSVAAACVRALGKGGAEIDRKTAKGLTAMHLAIQLNHPDLCYVLRDCGADVNKFSTEGYSIIYYGVVCTKSKNRAIENVKSILRLGVDLNVRDPYLGMTSLHLTCREDMPDVSKFLIQSSADPLEVDNSGATPLHIACTRGSLPCVVAVIQGFNNYVFNMLGTSYGVKWVNPMLAEIAVKKYADKDSMKKALMHPFLNAQDNSGNTPLHVACEYGFGPIVDQLIVSGADTDVMNEVGKTCYHLTAEIGHSPILEKMIYKEMDISQSTADGHTVLHYAAINNDADIMRLTLARFPQPNVRANNGWTPLHYAATYDSLKVIVVLLEWRADLSAENDERKTPMDLALRPQTIKALQGLMKEELEREELEKEHRLAKVEADREKKKATLKEESIAKAAARRLKAVELDQSSDSEPDEADPLKSKKPKRDTSIIAFLRRGDVQLPPSKPSSGKALMTSHKADRREGSSPRRIDRWAEKEKRIAAEKAVQEELDKIAAAELGVNIETLSHIKAQQAERPPPWSNFLDRGFFEFDRIFRVSAWLHLEKESKRINPWSYGLFECTSGPEWLDNLCIASVCPCYLTSKNARNLTKADGIRCCVGRLWCGCWADGAIRLFGFPFCHCSNHALVRRAIRKKYGLIEDEKCPDSYAVCCCFPCALVQEANELRLHGAFVHDSRHAAVINHMTE